MQLDLSGAFLSASHSEPISEPDVDAGAGPTPTNETEPATLEGSFLIFTSEQESAWGTYWACGISEGWI